MYIRDDIKNVLKDLKSKLEACSEIGLSDLVHTLNNAINIIEDLTDVTLEEED